MGARVQSCAMQVRYTSGTELGSGHLPAVDLIDHSGSTRTTMDVLKVVTCPLDKVILEYTFYLLVQ